jgi:hypothetical protein
MANKLSVDNKLSQGSKLLNYTKSTYPSVVDIPPSEFEWDDVLDEPFYKGFVNSKGEVVLPKDYI